MSEDAGRGRIVALINRRMATATRARTWASVKMPDETMRAPEQATFWQGQEFALEALRNTILFDQCTCGEYECEPYRCADSNR